MAAPALSWCLSLLVFFLSLDVPQVSTVANETSKLTCFYNSRANISCVWSWDGDLQNTSCEIHAQPDKRRFPFLENSKNTSCALNSIGPASWACNLLLGPPDSQKLTSVDIVRLSVKCLEGKEQKIVMTQDFNAFENLRLMAPNSLQVTDIGTHRCNITWNVSQSSHYIESYLEFEVRARSPGQTWEEAPLLTLKQNQRWICLETLLPDTSYELQVRVKPQLGSCTVWSPWSQPLAFRTSPAATALVKEALAFPWLGHILVGLSGAFGFIFLVYLLASCRYLGPWNLPASHQAFPDGPSPKMEPHGMSPRPAGEGETQRGPTLRMNSFSGVECVDVHTAEEDSEMSHPRPLRVLSQLSSEHGGDFQKWLSSPFPSSSFSPGGLAPEISPLEVLDRDAKATQLLLLQQDKDPSASVETSGHSLTSCFTNQGYFFFHHPDALEIESCQVYFTYDPCAEEPDEGGPAAPEGSLLPPLLPPPGEDHAYCTFPPGEDLLLFSPSLLVGPSPPITAPGGTGASEERLPPSLQEGVPRDWAPQLPGPSALGAPDLVDFQSPLENALSEAGEEVPAPGPAEAARFPWASPPGQGQVRAPTSCLTLNTDAYLSLQELQDQDPAHSL